MRKYDGLAAAPIFVEDRNSVFRSDSAHLHVSGVMRADCAANLWVCGAARVDSRERTAVVPCRLLLIIVDHCCSLPGSPGPSRGSIGCSAPTQSRVHLAVANAPHTCAAHHLWTR